MYLITVQQLKKSQVDSATVLILGIVLGIVVRWPTTVTAKSFSSRQNHFNHGKIILANRCNKKTPLRSKILREKN